MRSSPIPGKKLFARRSISSLIFFLAGLAALTWFLVRVIPKPSRAAYPCQQAAFPIASAFVIWLSGILSSSFLFVKAKSGWRRSKYVIASLLFLVAVTLFMATSTTIKHTPAIARAYIFTGNLLGNPLPVMEDIIESDSTVVEPSAIVGIVKSFQFQAEFIDFNEIASMVSEAVERAGGLEGIVEDGDTVILKPNLVVSVDGTASAQQLNPEVNGITTDYRVVQAVVNLVRQINPSGKIYVMEGSAMGSTTANMAVLNYGQITGIDSLICLEDASGAWSDTSSVYLQGVSLPPGKALYVGADNRYWLHKLYYNADVVISMPVLKNHCYTGATGGVKNVGIGATPPTIYAHEPDILRWRIDHENPPRTNLHNFIHDFFMCRPVDFVIMDGLQSIQNGPASTSTTQQLSDDQMNMRLILAGKDPIAIDAIGALLTGHDPQLIPHLVTLHNDSLGCCDARLIRVNGNKVGDEKKDFEIFDTGTLSKYDDFEPPSFMVNECYAINNQLYISLNVDDEVTKVEVSVDGIFLKQIVTGGYDNFTLDLDTLDISVGTPVTVWAYDRYLNHSSEGLIATSVPEGRVTAGNGLSLAIMPNPAGGIVDCQFGIIDFQMVSLQVYDLYGREIRMLLNEAKSPGEHTVRMDVSDLPAGMYLVRMQAGGQSAVRKLVVR